MYRSLISALLLLAPSLFAQPFVREIEGIPVLHGGTQVALPFAGGVNSPNHQFVDIDGDGDLDLFVLDTDLAVDFYRNEGTRFAPDFKLRPGIVSLPPFFIWFLFHDFDGDGRIDLITEDTTFSGARVFKNTGTTQSPQFTLLHPTLRDINNNDVFAGQNSTPAFVDIDADGDPDFISANFDGSANFYRNVGSVTNPRYQYITGSWQGILILGDTCIASSPTDRDAHGAATYRFADIDGDGDFDFFIGDLFSTGLFYLRNMGRADSARMVCTNNHYPPEAPVTTAGFNHVSFADIDGDGDLDMFVGVLAPLVQLDGFLFLRNTGTPMAPFFQQVTTNYLSTIDVGMNAHPVMADLDADGDKDLLIGTLNGTLVYYRNTGTAQSPIFTRIDNAFPSVTGSFIYAPALADIDNDGDLDLFIGLHDGRLRFYRNVGTPQAPAFSQQSSPVDTMNVLQRAAPALVDIDNDGDQDLFVGKANGRLSFYRNAGSPTNFVPLLESTTFQNIIAGQNSKPVFVDIDNDGDFDLFVGTFEGRVEFYRNDGTPAVPQFVRITNQYAGTHPTQDAAPAFADIDADGDLDLFLGTIKGGMHYYRNDLMTYAGETDELPLSVVLHQNYPNPFNPATAIRYEVPAVSRVILRVYDVLGKEIVTLVDEVKPAGAYTAIWEPAKHVASGVYLVRLTTPTTSVMRKMAFVR